MSCFSRYGFFLTLKAVFRRYPKEFHADFSDSLAFVIAAIFAILPIHTETIGIAQFRCEILGTLFALCAARVTLSWDGVFRVQSLGKYVLIFAFLGLSSLSKETFCFVAPAVCLVFYFFRGLNFSGKEHCLKSFLCILGFASCFWALVLIWLLQGEQNSIYSYGPALEAKGPFLLNQFEWASRAVIEGLSKVYLGYDLTTTRMNERYGLISRFLNPQLGIAFLCVLIFFLWLAIKRFRWVAIWVLTALLGYFPYVLIPNANLGSEHYWYFPSLALIAILIIGVSLATQRVQKPSRIRTLAVLVYVGVLWVVTFNRMIEMSNAVYFYRAELEGHPESLMARQGMLSVAIDKKFPDKEIDYFLDLIKNSESTNSIDAILEFNIYFKRNDLAKMEGALNKFSRFLAFDISPLEKRNGSDCYFRYALLLINQRKSCDSVKKALEASQQLDPGHPRWKSLKGGTVSKHLREIGICS